MGSSDPKRSSSNASKEEADQTLQDLQRSVSAQKEQAEQLSPEAFKDWAQDDDEPTNHTSRRGVLNQVQLSVYPDGIGDNLSDLKSFLEKHIDGAIGSLHLLPLYPSTGDRGFAPITFQEVDKDYGTWDDVQALGDEYQLCLEFVSNHVSPSSPEFKDFVENGEKSRYNDMFVRWEDVWPEGKPSAEQLAQIRTRKPAPPVIEVTLADGSKVPLWNTFKDQQIDIDPFSEEGWKFVESSLLSLCKNGGAKLIRLDAFGYVTKKPDSGCFMEEPEVWDLLAKIRELVKPHGVELLCEVHEDFNRNIKLAKHGFWVYDFALPMLLLHALKFKTAKALKRWLSLCPRRQITTLDTHDGMGVDDVAGLAPIVDVREVEQSILSMGGEVAYKHFYEPKASEADGDDSPSHSDVEDDGEYQHSKKSRKALYDVKDYLQPDCLKGCYTSVHHQYSTTYFSAVKEDPQAYLMARAVQFFTPGVPMVYYVGMLAGRNDFESLEKGTIRDINRHVYSMEEAEEEIKRPVVQALLKLCRFRNYHPAFQGDVFVDDTTPPHLLRVCWYDGTKHLAVLRADFEAREFSISHTPYKTPEETDESVERKGMADKYAEMDMSEDFEVDALEMMDRSEARQKVTDGVAGLGVIDPVQLVAMHMDKQAAAANDNSIDSTDGDDTSTQRDSSSKAAKRDSSSKKGDDTSTQRDSSSKAAKRDSSSKKDDSSSKKDDSSSKKGDSSSKKGDSSSKKGDSSSKKDDSSSKKSDGKSEKGVVHSMGWYDPQSDKFVREGSDGHDMTAEDQLAMKNQGKGWGLLKMDLSFAWKLQDKAVDDVHKMLEQAGAK